jgi:uncharacterized protein (TIGR03663 family)
LDKDKIIRWSILLVALFFCFTDLSLKPPHFDEGINGFFVNQIWENGFFTYDPDNYHGPLLFYLFQISEKIFGFGVTSFRIVSALFVFLIVAFILRSRITLGRHASLFAALALGLSPGMIFFGRSAIHESAFVFFQVLWMGGFLKAREEMNEEGLLWFFTGFLGCILLKETFVILGASFLLGWSWLEFSPRLLGWINMKVDSPVRLEFSPRQGIFLLKAGLVVVVVWLAFYTAFFHHWNGAHDFFIALTPWLKTGVGGSGHDKPFYYWVQLLGRYEWVGVIGVIGACAGIFSRSWKMRFISVLALANGFIYSYIHYKTPWCVISILWPFILVAAFWFENAVARVRTVKSPVFLLLSGITFVVMAHSAVAAYTLNFIDYTSRSEPYVYVQTSNDFKIIENIIRSRLRASPEFHNITIVMKLDDPWPLPWFFSRFPNVRYEDYRGAVKPDGDIIFSERDSDDSSLAGLYWRRIIDLRDARAPICVYLKKSVFEGVDLPGFSIVQGQGNKVS